MVSRSISADISASGNSYSGTYVGPAGGRSGLSGKRSGDSIDLAVRWAKPVNGDRAARMTIEKVGEDGLRLLTVDRDPATGKSVATSDITLKRL